MQENIDLNLARKIKIDINLKINSKNNNIKHTSRNRRMRENRTSGSNRALGLVTAPFDPYPPFRAF